ncbi:MAG: glycosyltransferase family 4 protein [Lachnospiraceae bacterium]|nr:glycosyltransferase family 4 protein [Lachnospiraceae bacterium]
MKILFLSHYDNLYGAGRALLNLVLGLKASGRHTPEVVLPAEGEFTEVLKKNGIKYHIHGLTQWEAIYREPISFAVKKHKRTAAIKAEIQSLAELFKDKGIDLIHSNTGVIGQGAMLSEILGCRHVWHIREFADLHYGMRFFYPEDEVRKYYESADRLIAISDAVKNYLEEKYPAAKVLRIYDGIYTSLQIEKKERSDDCFSFVCAGYLFKAKRQLDVIEAARLLKGGGRKFKLVFAGEGDKEYTALLKRKTESYGLGDVISFPGFVEDMKGLLADSDAGIIASEYEGFGLVTVEYMLAGLPVIGRRSGATPEIVKDGETGILYDDTEGLAAAMLKLMDDKETAAEFGRAGKIRAAEFSVSKNTEEIIKLYDSMEDEGKKL